MRVADYLKGRLLRVVLMFAFVYAGLAILTDAPFLIHVGNGLLLSISGAVCVVYARVAITALLNPRPAKGDYLAVGIFFGFLSHFTMRVISVAARDFGWPQIYNTDWTTLYLFIAVLAGALHLWAPNVAERKIPKATWMSVLLVAIGVIVALGVWKTHPPT